MISADVVSDVEIKIKHLERILAKNPLPAHVAEEWNMKMATSDRHCSLFTWPKPLVGFCVLSYDGSMTTTRSGYGGLIHSCDGNPLIGYVGLSKQQHILWIKMFTLYHGLMVARNHGITKLKINLDLKIVVDVTNNRSKCPWRVLSLKAKIIKVLEDFEHADIQHVWREANQPTDFLARWSTSLDEQLLSPKVFPPQLVEAIYKDVNQHVYVRL